MRIVVINHVTLVQGPGRPEEDTRDGFTHSDFDRANDGAAMSTTEWRKSGRSGSQGGECVEVAVVER